MTSSAMSEIRATTEMLKRLVDAIGSGSEYRLHAVVPLSKRCVYRVRLKKPFEELELPIVTSSIAVAFQRSVMVGSGKTPYSGVTLAPNELKMEKQVCTLLQISSYGATIDLHLEPAIVLANDSGMPWLLILDFTDPPAMAVAQPSNDEF